MPDMMQDQKRAVALRMLLAAHLARWQRGGNSWMQQLFMSKAAVDLQKHRHHKS